MGTKKTAFYQIPELFVALCVGFYLSVIIKGHGVPTFSYIFLMVASISMVILVGTIYYAVRFVSSPREVSSKWLMKTPIISILIGYMPQLGAIFLRTGSRGEPLRS